MQISHRCWYSAKVEQAERGPIQSVAERVTQTETQDSFFTNFDLSPQLTSRRSNKVAWLHLIWRCPHGNRTRITADIVNNTFPRSTKNSKKRGVVGVIFRDQKLLIIRRSMTVAAPGRLCLPGGTIEFGESEEVALVREMQEELAIDVQPVRLVWRSVTAWGTKLAWWLAELDHESNPIANPDEVAEVHWMSSKQIRSAKGMLASLPQFIDAIEAGTVSLEVKF